MAFWAPEGINSRSYFVPVYDFASPCARAWSRSKHGRNSMTPRQHRSLMKSHTVRVLVCYRCRRVNLYLTTASVSSHVGFSFAEICAAVATAVGVTFYWGGNLTYLIWSNRDGRDRPNIVLPVACCRSAFAASDNDWYLYVTTFAPGSSVPLGQDNC